MTNPFTGNFILQAINTYRPALYGGNPVSRTTNAHNNPYFTKHNLNKFMTRLNILVFLTLLLALTGSPAMAIEEPDFEIIDKVGDIEIRQYKRFIIAETVISTDKSRSAASNEGFRRLFSYISGNNTAREKITMTAPVLQSASGKSRGEKIEMTAPVQQTATEEGWVVAFVLPLDYTMETAPVPGDERISIREISGRTMAVKRFSGRWNDKTINRHQKLLMEEVNEHGIEVEGNIEFAAYNAPFSLPFMRRNEVMIPVK